MPSRLLAALAITLAIGLGAASSSAEETDQTNNLIKNGTFERWVAYDDVIVGENWATWSTLGRPLWNRHGHEPGQQIMSERAAFVAGIYQEISGVKPGALYYGFVGTASLYWGNTEEKFEELCRSIGIDTLGGTNPTAPSIVWGNATCSNKRWEWKDDPKANGPKVWAIAGGPKITFFIKAEFLRGDNLAQAWFQDAAVFLLDENPKAAPTQLPSARRSTDGGGYVNSPGPNAPPAAPGQPAPPAAGVPAGIQAGGAGPDFPLLRAGAPVGRFFTQTAKDGTGFAVLDDGVDRDGKPTRWWSEYQRLGGLEALGYPISRVHTGGDGFLYQAFQRGVLQWRPESSTAVLANIMDALSDAGRDEWLRGKGVPPAVKDDGSRGDYAAAVRTRLGWLTQQPITDRYLRGLGLPGWTREDSIGLYGLPSSEPVRSGPFIVQRFQRVAFQLWVERAEGAPPPGSVVAILSGDLYAEAGLVPAAARQPEQPPR